MLESLFSKVREASIELPSLGDETINDILLAVADAAEAQTERILQANALDLERMDPSNPMYDRLKLTPERIAGIAADMRKVATLPSPLGRVLKHTVLPNGLDLQRVSVPFGVIGVVYEARPNVTFDVFSLCLKSGNACLLKGGKDADESNRCIVSIIKEVLAKKLSGEIGGGVVELLPATHEATAELLHARGWVDLVIPRGSKRLIDFVRQEATVPVIETGAGVCHAYFDEAGDVEKGARIINNAKTRRVSVCNALDCLLIHQRRLNDLPALLAPMAQSNVIIYADPLAYQVLTSSHLSPLGESEGGFYPHRLIQMATADTYGTEFQDYAMAVRTVTDLQDALRHIREYGSGHSECIITEDAATAQRFLTRVDAACVYHNAPTSFTDGAQFRLGAEIGISTQKLHARGPMALEEMTTYKWLIRGNGQTRPK